MTPKVSIITPSYNSSEFIEETIKSVLAQTFQDWEWLITDDKSSDNTAEIIKKYGDPRIKLQVLEQNGGAGNARNKSLERASGRYIAFLDSDDLWYPEYLETMIGFMEEKNGDLKIHSTISKKARGKFLSEIIKRKITNIREVETIKFDGFEYKSELSTENNLAFVDKR